MAKMFDILLAVTVFYCTFQIVLVLFKSKKVEYMMHLFAMLSFSAVFLAGYIEAAMNLWGYSFDKQLMIDWSNITGIAFALTGISFLIFYSKPPFARFPAFLCLVPLLIIPAYYFASHTLVLKEWLMRIYQGGGLLVALLMNGALIRKKWEHLIAFIGYLILTAAYSLFWFSNLDSVIWKLFLIAGMFILFHGFRKMENPDEESEVGLANPPPSP